MSSTSGRVLGSRLCRLPAALACGQQGAQCRHAGIDSRVRLARKYLSLGVLSLFVGLAVACTLLLARGACCLASACCDLGACCCKRIQEKRGFFCALVSDMLLLSIETTPQQNVVFVQGGTGMAIGYTLGSVITGIFPRSISCD